MSTSSTPGSAALLRRQLKQMQTDKDIPGISCGLVNDSNIYEWEVMLMINDETKYYGGTGDPPFPIAPFPPLPCALCPLPSSPLLPFFNQTGSRNPKPLTFSPSAGANFRARLKFPPEYPLMPPALTFQDPIPFHPNVYPDTGLLCISILHPPEEDKYGYEAASERWSPVQTPETILLSVISLFASPNDESPANPEAAKLLREERAGANKDFRKRVRKCVRESLGED